MKVRGHLTRVGSLLSLCESLGLNSVLWLRDKHLYKLSCLVGPDGSLCLLNLVISFTEMSQAFWRSSFALWDWPSMCSGIVPGILPMLGKGLPGSGVAA